MIRPKVLILLAVVTFQSQLLFSQGFSSQQIDSLVNASMAAMPQAGVAVAVVRNGKVIHLKGYGVTSVESSERVDKNTLFAIASNTKAFTSVALAMLVDEGKLRWDDKVIDHIPEFRMYDPYVTAKFNIQDLLTHRSGLGLGAGDLMFFPDGGNYTIDDILRSFQYQTPVSPFRTKYDYDNLCYIVAGEVVARISGMTWDEFIQERIIKPLGMERSAAIFQNLTTSENIAYPHSSYKGEVKQLQRHLKGDGSLGAAGGVYSSVSDMSKWLLMHLNGGKYGKDLSKQLISAQNYAEMWKPHTNIAFSVSPVTSQKSHFIGYGLGWFITDVNGYIVIHHTGGTVGMLSSSLMVPELNIGIVVLTNANPGGNSYAVIRDAILDSYTGIEKPDRIAIAKKQITDREASTDSVLLNVWNIVNNNMTKGPELNQYIGIYRDKWFGDVEITKRNDGLWFRSIRSPKLSGEMLYYQANTFVVKWSKREMECDAFASFGLNENGQAITIKMKGISPAIDFSYDFHDLDLKRIEDNQLIKF
jgi:CubicO group peptidase (beta-lactamase class C family)